MERANQRIKVLRHDLAKLDNKDKDGDSDDDDDLDDREGLMTELNELQSKNEARLKKLDEYEKNKKWNVDNMSTVAEERTVINPTAAETSYTPSGFVRPKDVEVEKSELAEEVQESFVEEKSPTKPIATKSAPKATGPTERTGEQKPKAGPSTHVVNYEDRAIETYPEFTNKYAETVEEFMQIPDLEGSKEFLLKYGDILLQENASNYLLLASLEDEMNGYREKMKRTARQSQIISHIAELAKTLNTHPGNVIIPFFTRMGQREHLEEFLAACNSFVEKIITRAVVKRHEIDEARAAEEAQAPVSLEDMPREQRLGPGGLDPLEVIKTLPKEIVAAFESRQVQALHDALMNMDPKDAEYHMKRCVDSGLWVANANSQEDSEED
jgi:cell division cycle protein 37